jgi:hypothetical protein
MIPAFFPLRIDHILSGHDLTRNREYTIRNAPPKRFEIIRMMAKRRRTYTLGTVEMIMLFIRQFFEIRTGNANLLPHEWNSFV